MIFYIVLTFWVFVMLWLRGMAAFSHASPATAKVCMAIHRCMFYGTVGGAVGWVCDYYTGSFMLSMVAAIASSAAFTVFMLTRR